MMNKFPNEKRQNVTIDTFPYLSFGIEFFLLLFLFLWSLCILITIVYHLFRQNGPIQSYSHAEVGSPPSTNEPLAGYARLPKPSHFPHISQNSPSRLGQQYQRSSQGRPTNSRVGDWNHMKVQAPPPNFNSGGPLSPGNSSFGNGMSWGTF